jgi:hypothetical protein
MAAWFVPAMMAVSTGLTIMGHKQNIKNIKANAAWKNYEDRIQRLHERTKLAKKQAKLLSEQRARVGASGIQFTGSPLIMANADMKSYEEDLMWLEKGYFIKSMAMESEVTGMIASETYKMGNTLLSAGIGYENYQTNQAIAEKLGV